MKELTSLQGASRIKSNQSSPKPALLKRGKHDLRPLYAFLITLVLYVVALLVCNKYPFGKYSFLLSDLQAQYAPFLALLRSKLAEIGSVSDGHLLSFLSYSFKLGLGKNFTGSYGYYMASPFNFIYLLFNEAQIDAAVIAIVVAKLSLSSAFMCLFLGSKTDNKKTLWPVLLGIMYAFSLYSQAFLFQIMWLDGYMLLPLILYFTERFIKKQKYAGLVLSLLVLFIANYYIAYMVGIASFLYLCIRLFEERLKIKEALGIGLRFVLTAGFTGLVTAVMLVPVGIDTIKNADRTIVNNSNSLITYSPITLINMMLLGDSGDFADVLSSNYPFLFICLPVTILMILYFISPVFKGRERRIHGVCVAGAILSTLLYPLDKAWQVFDDPNWFYHRQSFVFLPIFLIIALKVLPKLKIVARKDIVKVILVMVALTVIDYSFGDMKDKSTTFILNISLSVAYCLIMMGYGFENWHDQLRDMPKLLSPIMSFFIVFELIGAGLMMSSGIVTLTNYGGSAEEYSDSIRAEAEFGDYSKAQNAGSGAFRAEGEHTPEYTTKYYAQEGESFYGNYNGLSFFNSNSNKSMQHFIKQLGYPTNYNYFAVNHSFACPSTDAFLSIGSMSTRRELAFYRLEGQDSYGSGMNFYANDDVMPLAFAADKGAMDFDFYRLEKDAVEKNYFAFQNDWYHSLYPNEFNEGFFNEIDAGVLGEPVITNASSFDKSAYITHEEYLNKISGESSASSGVNSDPLGLEASVSKELADNITVLYRNNENIPIAVEYEFRAPNSDEIYCSVVGGRILDETNVYVNGILTSECSGNTYYSQIFRVGSFQPGENVKVTFLSDSDSWSYLNIRFASFDYAAFRTQFENIDKTKVDVVEVSDGYAKFNINGLDAEDTVITTIPEEAGWQLFIDGAPVEHNVYQKAFIAFDVPSGSHTAELVFTAPGLKFGAVVSCVGIVCLAAFIVIDKNRSKMKENN